MKKVIIAVATVVAIALVSFFLARDNKEEALIGGVPAPTAEVSNLSFKGEVTDINTEQSKVDGSYLFAIKEVKGNEVIISVSSGGAHSCAASANIADPTTIKKGMMIEVNGALRFDGDIVPCESVNHYFRIVNGK